MEWKGEEYALNNSPQREWGIDLVHRLLSRELDGPASATGNLLKDQEVMVLDLGCGDGGLTSWVASHRFPHAKVVGADPSQGQLNYARATYGSERLTFRLASATELPEEWKESFHAVLSFTALHWVKDQRLVLQQIRRVLVKDGLLAFTLPLTAFDLLEVLDTLVALPEWHELKDFVSPSFALNHLWIEDFIKEHHPHPEAAAENEKPDKRIKRQEREFVEAYRRLLISNGFEADIVAIHPGPANFSTEEAMKGFVAAWLPHRQQLPEAKRDSFMNALIRAYLQRTNQSSGEGKEGLHMWFGLLQVKARKL